MDQRRIAIIDHVGLKAGMEFYDTELYLALKESGNIPYVYSNFSSPDKDKNILPVFRFRVRENIFTFGTLFLKYFSIRSALKREKIEYCILHGFRFSRWDWLLLRVLRKVPAKKFMIVHDPESLIAKRSSLKWRSKIFSLFTNLVVHNQYSFDELSSGLSTGEKEKLLVIPHGNFIRMAESSKQAVQKGKDLYFDTGRKTILFFGQIKESKGLDVLLEALPDTDHSINLIIAGRMRRHSFAVYESLIKKHQMQDRVRLCIQYISPDTRDYLFKNADAVVLPYRKVFQSGVMLLAMSYAKAVIASDLESNREMIIDRQNGFLFKEGSRGQLAETINYVMENDSERKKAAENGYKFVQSHHDWKSIAEKWNRLFNL